MRVGLLTSDLFAGHGWGQYSLRLIEGLQAGGCEVCVLAARNSPSVADLDLHPILSSVAPAERGLWLRTLLNVPRASSLLRDCDVIHTTIEAYAPLAVAIAGNRPTFVTVHGSYARLPETQRWPASPLYAAAFRKAHLLCVSSYTESVVRRVVPEAQTAVIHNGVDADHFASATEDAVKKKGTLVLSSGGVKTRKGTLQLVQAMAHVRKQIPDARCVILGTVASEKNYVRHVRAEVARLDLERTVELKGFVSDAELRHWYQQADVFVLPSINDGWKFEGYGLVYLEAGAAGLPVIGTTENGAEDAIDEGITGLLVSQADVAAELPDAILKLLRNPDLARQMGAAGQEKAKQQTWERVAGQVIAAYQSAK